MPIPKPNKDESQNSFISRCMSDSVMKKEFPEQKQRSAVCYDSWRKSKMSNNRVLMHFCTDMFNAIGVKKFDKVNKIDFERSTVIVGDGIYNGIYFPVEELEKAYMTWDRQPINLDHSDKVEDIVGYVTEPAYERNSITVKPVIDDVLPKSVFAKGYIASRLKAGAIPEVSIGVWLDRFEEETDSGNRLTARNLQGDHLALVTRGACSPQDGCGIGLEKKTQIPISTHTVKHEDYIDLEYDSLIKKIYKERIKKEKLRR